MVKSPSIKPFIRINYPVDLADSAQIFDKISIMCAEFAIFV